MIYTTELCVSTLALGGYYFDAPWALWTGAAACGLALLLDLLSGVMRLPVFPALFVAVGAVDGFSGAAAGLAAWTAISAAGGVYARFANR